MEINEKLQKNFSLLKEVHKESLTGTKGPIIDDIVKNHRVSTVTGVVIRRDLMEKSGNSRGTKWRWNTIPPNLEMARELIIKVRKYQERSKVGVQVSKLLPSNGLAHKEPEYRAPEQQTPLKAKPIISAPPPEEYTIKIPKRAIKVIVLGIKLAISFGIGFIIGNLRS